MKIIVISLIWDIFWAAIRVKNKSFNREVKSHIDKQYEKFFFELAHPNDEVIGRLNENNCKIYRTDKMGEIIIKYKNNNSGNNRKEGL